jgi:predicted nucleotidyltransferase
MKRARLMPVDEALIERVRDRIVEACRPRALYLFGSAARREVREGSDLDLMVVMDLPEGVRSYEKAGELSRLFDTWLLPLDILVRTPAQFERGSRLLGFVERTVLREGKLLYEAEDGHASP